MSEPHPLLAAHLPGPLASEKEVLRQVLDTPERNEQIITPLLKDLNEVILKHRETTAHLPIPITPGEVTLALLHLGAVNTMKNRERVLPLPEFMTQILQIFANLIVSAHRRITQAESKQQPAG